MNKCEYCEKLFSTKSNLINHQKTAKFCLDKRETEYKEYICICEIILTNKIYYYENPHHLFSDRHCHCNLCNKFM